MISFGVVSLIIIVLYSFMCLPNAFGSHYLNTNTKNIITLSTYLIILLIVAIVYHQTFSSRYTDAMRMYSEMQDSLVLGSKQLFEAYNLNPISALLLLGVAYTGDFDVLKSISAVIFWGGIFLIAWKVRDSVHPAALLLSTLFILCFVDLSYPADTVRFPMAMMIFCCSIIIYFFVGKNNVIFMHLFCITSLLLHASLWPFYLTYFFVKFANKVQSFIIYICSLFYFPVLGLVSKEISQLSPSFGWKMQLYFTPDSQYYEGLISKQQTAFCIIGLCAAISIVAIWAKVKELKTEKNKSFIRFFILCTCIVIGSFPSNVAFARLVPIVVILSLIPLTELLSSYFGDRTTLCKFKSQLSHVGFLLIVVFIIVSMILRFYFSYEPFYLYL